MGRYIGIRREDKSRSERRVPVTPEDARALREEHGIEAIVQPSGLRIIPDEEYRRTGTVVQDDLSECDVIFGVKEIPPELFQAGKSYVFFSHVAKGQSYNMPMLGRLMELGCDLIDYEKVSDDSGRRLIFFGRHAGIAGMFETLWALGRRLDWEGIANPFGSLRRVHEYAGVASLQAAARELGAAIRSQGVPESLAPVVIGVAGYGNVARGAWEILEQLPIVRIAPDQVPLVAADPQATRHVLYVAEFREGDTAAPIVPGTTFDLQDFYRNPEKYQGQFERYAPCLTLVVNCIYWEKRFPRLLTTSYLKGLYAEGQPRLRVIGDISCDIEGGVEVTVRSTEPDAPVYVYDVRTGEAVEGWAGAGPVIMAVDILPSELPLDASVDFSRVLRSFIPAIASADFSMPFESLELPPEIRRALIVLRGELTPQYRYLEAHVRGPNRTAT